MQCMWKIAISLYKQYTNATNTDYETALLVACRNNNTEVVNMLLRAGTDPNAADADGYKCLHQAIVGGCSKEIIQRIIDHGGDVNAKNTKGETALLIACLKRNEDVLIALLNAGADPNITDIKRDTCLHWAVSRGCSKETLLAIIDGGADVNAINRAGQTALMCAYGTENTVAISVLLNAGANPDIADVTGYTCLHVGVMSCSCKETLQELIDHGVDVNATDTEGQTALMVACLKGNENAIVVLLNAGADPDIPDVTGHKCLQNASFGGCGKDIMLAILEHGANVNDTDKWNRTALMAACDKRNADAVHVLLNAGADPNISSNFEGNEGYTCLMFAVGTGCRKEIVQALVDNGANVNATDKKGQTALMYACSTGNANAISIILNAGADPNIANAGGATCLYNAFLEGYCSKDTLQELIDHGADVNATNKDKVTILMLACMNKYKINADTVHVLLNAGADPNISSNLSGSKGYTCLHLAIETGCSNEIVQALIDKGADVNATSMHDTALDSACAKRSLDTINILLNAGADPNIAGANGVTSLQFAVHIGCSNEILQALISHSANANA